MGETEKGKEQAIIERRGNERERQRRETNTI